MNTDHILPYVIKAKSYGSKVLIVSEDEKTELTRSLVTAGLDVKWLETFDILLNQNPEYRESLVWANTVIFFGEAVIVDSGVAFNLISEKTLQETLPPHEVFNGSWEQHSISKLASFHHLVEAWKEVQKVWPQLAYSEKVDDIALIYAGADSGISIAHLCTCDLVDYVNMLKNTGAKKFLCYNLMETVQLDSILKVQLVADAMPEIPHQDFIYITSAYGMQSSWQKFCIKNQIANPISIISGNWYDQTWYNTSWMPTEDEVKVPDFEPQHMPSKTFLCFNNTPRWHRTKLVTELVHNDLHKDGLISLRNNEPRSWDELGLDKSRPEATQWLKDNIPLSIDDTNTRKMHIAFPDDTDVALHRDTHFSLVTETIYQSNNDLPYDNSADFLRGGIFFTEKTYKPMWFKQAFIVCAVPGFLEYMKELGWQTFHPYIDESYDQERDDNKRLEMIVSEVKRLNNNSKEDWLRFRQGVQTSIELNAERIRREHSGELTTSPWEQLFK